jgi:hypothetical protein
LYNTAVVLNTLLVCNGAMLLVCRILKIIPVWLKSHSQLLPFTDIAWCWRSEETIFWVKCVWPYYRFYLSIITCIKHVFYQKHKHDQDRAGLILIIKMNYKFKFRVMTFFCQSDSFYWTRDFSFKLQPFHSLGC